MNDKLNKTDIPPDFDLITDGIVYKWRKISTSLTSIFNYSTKIEAIRAAWSHYYYLQSKKKRTWRKVK